MILAIDIGNTNISIGGFFGDEPSFVIRISTNTHMTEDEYASRLLGILSMHNVGEDDVRGAIISSVVPKLNNVVKKAVNLVYGVDALLVGPGVKTGIGIHCDNPASVGADLICAAVAANHLYTSPCLIVDMGTATKMTLVDKKGAFAGVSIIPGVLMGLDALAVRTAQLPQVSLDAPTTVIGKNTVDCMKSGVIYGNASLVDGMIDRINEEVGEELPVYATGGLASIIVGYCKHKITMDEHLVLKGLYMIYNKNK